MMNTVLANFYTNTTNCGRCESSMFLKIAVSFYVIISCMVNKNKGFEDAVSINVTDVDDGIYDLLC